VPESPASGVEPSNPEQKKTALETALGLVTDVRHGEATTALLLTLNAFVLLTAYSVIKPVREGLVLELEGGAEYKSYMSAAIAILLVPLVPLYSAFASRVPRNRLVVGVTIFFFSHLLLFYFASSLPALRTQLGLVFYVWVGIFNMMLVAQFWAFANDIYDKERGKRLFPLVGIGASLGAALGAKIAELLAERIGVYQLLLVSAGLLSLCAGLFHWVHQRESAREATLDASGGAPTAEAEAGPQKRGYGFDLVFKHKYLTLLAVFSLTFTLVNTNGEYMLSKLFKEAASAAVASGSIPAGDAGKYITRAYGQFHFYVNVAGVLLQTFAVSRIVKFGGLKLAFLVLPVIAALGQAAFLALPVLAVLRLSKTAENATDYSLNNTVRNMLWLPTTREMKYQAKQAVDTFFVRMGDVASAGIVALAGAALGVGLRTFAVINLCIIFLWLFVAIAILRENQRLSEPQAP
jgi:AAA family ATP:ADP antiporter